MARHQQSIIISDIELLAIAISIAIWGIPGEGVAHIVGSDNVRAISWMNKRSARRGVSLGILEPFSAWAIRYNLKVVVAYMRTYRNVSADALTRNTMKDIEHRAGDMGCEWVKMPAMWSIFCTSVKHGPQMAEFTPVGLYQILDFSMNSVGWGPIGYTVCIPITKTGVDRVSDSGPTTHLCWGHCSWAMASPFGTIP